MGFQGGVIQAKICFWRKKDTSNWRCAGDWHVQFAKLMLVLPEVQRVLLVSVVSSMSCITNMQKCFA